MLGILGGSGNIPDMVRSVAVRRKKVAATLHITSITSCPTLFPPPRPSFMGTLGTRTLLPAPRWILLGRFHPGPPDLWILCWTKCRFCLFCERFLKGQCRSLFIAFASLFSFCGHWSCSRCDCSVQWGHFF